MCDDPIVAEVRRTRQELARKFNFDVAAIFRDLRERQAGAGPRLVRRSSRNRTEKPVGPGEQRTPPLPGR